MSMNSLFGPIERLITEHGSAAILRERLELIKAKLADQEAQNRDLQAKYAQAQADVLKANSRARELQQQLDALQSGQHTGLCCDHCGSLRLTRTGSRPHHVFGVLGDKEALFRCLDCGGETAQIIT